MNQIELDRKAEFKIEGGLFLACVSILLIACALIFTGCATVAHGTTQVIPVNSSPTGATVTVQCGAKSHVSGNPVTPTSVILKRNVEDCSITLSKKGYDDSNLRFNRKVSAWFWAGNILVGGYVTIPLYMMIDAIDGAMYNKTPKEANITLSPSEQEQEASK